MIRVYFNSSIFRGHRKCTIRSVLRHTESDPQESGSFDAAIEQHCAGANKRVGCQAGNLNEMVSTAAE